VEVVGERHPLTAVERVELPPNVRLDSLCCCGHVKTQHKHYRTRHSAHTYGWGRCAKCRCAKFRRTDPRPKAGPGA
jgi:hypothetical protein